MIMYAVIQKRGDEIHDCFEYRDRAIECWEWLDDMSPGQYDLIPVEVEDIIADD